MPVFVECHLPFLGGIAGKVKPDNAIVKMSVH
jgi:hypothetical protein